MSTEPLLLAFRDMSLRMEKVGANWSLAPLSSNANRPKDQLDIVALEEVLRGEDPNA